MPAPVNNYLIIERLRTSLDWRNGKILQPTKTPSSKQVH